MSETSITMRTANGDIVAFDLDFNRVSIPTRTDGTPIILTSQDIHNIGIYIPWAH